MRTKEAIIQSHIYTNDDGYTLCELFKDLISPLSADRICLSALVGYFRSSGYFALAENLKSLKKIRILVGIDADALSVEWYRKARQLREAKVRELAYRQICAGIEQEIYRTEVKAGLKSFVEDILSERLEMRAIDSRIAHAKFYVFAPEGYGPNDFRGATLVTGSSNFTAPGLGAANEEGRRNYELNIDTSERNAVSFALSEFERLWAESVELIPTEMAEAVHAKTRLFSSLSPSDFYYRFLQEVFKDTVDDEGTGIEHFFPQGFKRLSYQIDAVNEGLGMLQRHDGFFLADVVGLGKTVVAAILLLRWFASRDKSARALVVAPPVLIDNWQTTFDRIQISRKKYRIVSSGSLHKIQDAAGYSIVIVDEAHNFRNANTEAYRRLEAICKEGGELGRKSVILVSATPLNNEPKEILNLLKLFQDTRVSSLGVSDLEAFFQDKQRRYEEARRIGVDPEQARLTTKAIYTEIRELVLQDITIRRTRSDLLENALYKQDLLDQGISFPAVQKPRVIHYYLDSLVDGLFDDTLEALSQGLFYAYHRQLDYVTGPAREKFDIPENAFIQLAGLLKRFFMKRLDSSFSAFRESLRRFFRDTEALQAMYRAGKVYYSNSVDVTQYIGNEDVEGLVSELESNRANDPSITLFTPTDFRPEFERELGEDAALLASLVSRWDQVAEDPKFDEFAGHLDAWLRESVNPGRRLVVFSESAETVYMLRDRLVALGRTDVLAVSATKREASQGGRQDLELAIRANFDANYPGAKEDRYRILLTTDVLAEGVNLHRANTVVNYDTPWNSVRLFQRVGRVNRVGSMAQMVFIYNFFPLPRVDDQIELKKKAQIKLQAFHSAFGEDAPIYSPEEEVEHFGLFGSGGLEEEGASPKVRLLLELRRLMREEPERYERIRKLPQGLRCLRGGPDAGLVFLSTPRKDLFYLRDDAGAPIRLVGLIEAASRLKAGEEEAALEFDYDWEAPISRALASYQGEEERKKEEETRARRYSSADGQAIRILSSYLDGLGKDFLGIDASEAALFSKAIALIRAGAATRNLIKAITESARNATGLTNEALARHLLTRLRDSGVEDMPEPQARRTRDFRSAIEAASFVMAEAWIDPRPVHKQEKKHD